MEDASTLRDPSTLPADRKWWNFAIRSSSQRLYFIVHSYKEIQNHKDLPVKKLYEAAVSDSTSMSTAITNIELWGPASEEAIRSRDSTSGSTDIKKYRTMRTCQWRSHKKQQSVTPRSAAIMKDRTTRPCQWRSQKKPRGPASEEAKRNHEALPVKKPRDCRQSVTVTLKHSISSLHFDLFYLLEKGWPSQIEHVLRGLVPLRKEKEGRKVCSQDYLSF